ncbi:MAG: transposase [Monoglobaceae bacterium]
MVEIIFGSIKRKMKTQLGEVEFSVPHDRNGEYEL